MIKLILASVIAMLLGILFMGILPVVVAKVVIKRNPNSWFYRGEADFIILMLGFIPIIVLYMTLPASSMLLTLTLSSYTIGVVISAIALRIAAKRNEKKDTTHTPV